MSVETDVETLKKQVAFFVTRAQTEALLAAQAGDFTTMNAQLTLLITRLNTVISQLQSINDQIADHEERITDLEP